MVYDFDAGLQGFNLFAYCGNNPISRIDISGADSEDNRPYDTTPEEEALLLGNGGDGKISGGTISSSILENTTGRQFSDYSGTSGKTEVHHIVEQCQASKSGFSNSQIQADSNKVVLDYSTHRAISGYYSSKPPELNGLRVRDWLAGKSFDFQTQFGWNIVNKYYSATLESIV